MLDLQSKKNLVSKISKKIKDSLSIIILDYRGVKANEVINLRRECYANDVYVRVVKNTLLARAIKGSSLECLDSVLSYPTMIACSMKYPGAAARIFNKFFRENVNFVIKAIFFENKLIPIDQVSILANLPTYLEAMTRLIVILQEISVRRLLNVLVSIYRSRNT